METTVHVGGHQRINAQQVIMLTADQNYTRIFLEDGKQLYVATTLKTLERRFGVIGCFFRVNRSNILNMRFASESSYSLITLNNSKTFQVSRRRQTDFIDFHNSFFQN